MLASANPPLDKFTPEQIATGGNIHEGNCGICHGAGARSSGLVPDLRRSAALSDHDDWRAIVHTGVLNEQGMVGFDKWFSKEDIEAVRAYVGEQSKYLAATTASRQ